MKQMTWIIFGWLMLNLTAQAASFDCAKTQTRVEHLICDNPEISKLDDELSVAYKAALKDQAQSEAIKQAQKKWMKERNGCADAVCVKRAYEARISKLLSLTGDSAQHGATGKYRMISDTIFTPQPNGITKVEEHAEVCTAFLKNLESFPSFPPMACDVKFKPDLSDFKTPEWQDIDVWENRDLELQLGKTLPKDDAEKERWLTNIKSYIKAGMLAYRTARFDIDNDGVPDQVLARIHGKCDPAKKNESAPYWRHYEVYNPVTRDVDAKKADFYGSYWDTASLFSYRGVTYYASLLGGSTTKPYFRKHDHANKWYIRLYRPMPMNKGIKQSVALGCEYLYLPTRNEGGY